MPETIFRKAVNICGLKQTTYLRRDGLFLDEPLINFSKETQLSNAHHCFNAALNKVDEALTAAGAKHVSYIWEWTE